MTWSRAFLATGAFSGALAVLLGAFAAHGLRARLSPELLAVFQTGVQYQFYHALGLMGVALAMQQLHHSAWLRWAGALMIAGVLLFSGALYLLALTGQRSLGAIAPIGGLALVVGWICLAAGALRG